MRIISFIIASVFAATSPAAWAEAASAEPAKTETPATTATQDNSAEATKPVTQASIAKPRASGVDQPLCTGE